MSDTQWQVISSHPNSDVVINSRNKKRRNTSSMCTTESKTNKETTKERVVFEAALDRKEHCLGVPKSFTEAMLGRRKDKEGRV